VKSSFRDGPGGAPVGTLPVKPASGVRCSQSKPAHRSIWRPLQPTSLTARASAQAHRARILACGDAPTALPQCAGAIRRNRRDAEIWYGRLVDQMSRAGGEEKIWPA